VGNSFPKKAPVFGSNPTTAKLTKQIQPVSDDSHSPAWQFHRRDIDHSQWGWHRLTLDEFNGVIEALSGFDTMRWFDILSASGGRSSGNNNHFIDVDRLAKGAQKRLIELRLDDQDRLFSLRLQGKVRVFGIKEGRILRVLWYDRDHSVCPMAR
jgi:hypothetical protein